MKARRLRRRISLPSRFQRPTQHNKINNAFPFPQNETNLPNLQPSNSLDQYLVPARSQNDNIPRTDFGSL